MSRITFTTRGRDTSVPGSERVRAALITGELTGRVLGLDDAAGWMRARRILPRVFFDFSLMPGVLEESPSSRFASWANVAGAFRQREIAWENLEQLDAQAVWDHTIGALLAERASRPWLRLAQDCFRDLNYADGFTAADAVAAADEWWQQRGTRA